MAAPLTDRQRQIVALVSEQPRTLYETAKILGVPSGHIFRQMRRMVDDGVLVADPDPPRRGTLYSASPLSEEALQDAIPGDAAAGVLRPMQRIVIVYPNELGDLYRVLDRPSLGSCVAWLAEIDGAGGVLIGLHEGTPMLQAHRLTIAFERSGARVMSGVVSEVLPGNAVRGAAARSEARGAADYQGAR